MAERNIHITRSDEDRPEIGIQIRGDSSIPPDLFEGKKWIGQTLSGNSVEYTYLNGEIKESAYVGDSQGQVLFDVVTTGTTNISDQIANDSIKTIFLRYGTYDFNPSGTIMQVASGKSIIGERSGTGQSNNSVINLHKTVNFFNNISTINLLSVSYNDVNKNRISTTTSVAGIQVNTWNVLLENKYYNVKSVTSGSPNLLTFDTDVFIKEAKTGMSATAINMADSVVIENVDINLYSSTAMLFKNIRNVIIRNCRFNNIETASHKIISFENCQKITIENCIFNTTKLSFVNNCIDVELTGNKFNDKEIDAATYTVEVYGNCKTRITANVFDGFGKKIKLSSGDNVISNNMFYNFSHGINITAGNNNIVSSNVFSEGVSTSYVTTANCFAVKVANGIRNIISSNSIKTTIANAIYLTASATNNIVSLNTISASNVYDEQPANNNRVDDDLSRSNDPLLPYTGLNKDWIDVTNNIRATLQAKQSNLVSKNVSYISGSVSEEEFVYFNTVSNNYEPLVSGTTMLPAGIITSGDLISNGIYTFVNTSNVKNANIFNPSYIGQRFYLTDGNYAVPESLFPISGNINNQRVIGSLIDIVGGSVAYFYILPHSTNNFSTPQNTWKLGSNDNNIKKLMSSDVSGNAISVVLDPAQSAVKIQYSNGDTAIVEQSLNNYQMKNSIRSYLSGELSVTSTSQLTVYPHSVYVNGLISNASETVLPVLPVASSKYVYLLHNVSGSTYLSETFDNNTTLLSVEYINTTLNQFDPARKQAIMSGNKTQMYYSSGIVPADDSFTSIGHIFFPVYEGRSEIDVTAEATAFATLTSGAPYQYIESKLTVDGVDIPGTSRMNSLFYNVSSDVYENLLRKKIVVINSGTRKVIRIDFMARYTELSTPVTFDDINIVARL